MDRSHDEDLPLRVRDLAARLGMRSPHPLYKAVAAGRLRHYKVGKTVWVRFSDWMALLEANVVEAGSPRPADPQRSERARHREARRAERVTAKVAADVVTR